MHMTDRGLLALVRHEGLVPGPYLDVKQVWTFGIGHTAAAGPPDPATMPRGMPADLDAGIREAFRVFRADLARYEAAVQRAVKVPLAARVRCACQFPLQHWRHRKGRTDPAPQCRQSPCSRRRVSELAATGLHHPPPGGGARPVPPRPLSRRHDPGLVRGSHGPGGLLATDPSPD
jgi:hypothetical protein